MKSKHLSSKKSPFINYLDYQANAREQEDLTMDWSCDTPPITMPSPYVPPVGHMSLPHVPLPQGGSRGSNVSEMSSFRPGLLNYGNGQPTDLSSWDGAYQALSLFGAQETLNQDVKNIQISLERLTNHIKNFLVSINGNRKQSGEYIPIIKGLCDLINATFYSKWNYLVFDVEKSLMINKSIVCFYEKPLTSNINKPVESTTPPAPTATLSLVATHPTTSPIIPPPIKNSENVVKKASKPSNVKKSYAKASKTNILSNIEDILRIKEAFLSLSADEVGCQVHKQWT